MYISFLVVDSFLTAAIKPRHLIYDSSNIRLPPTASVKLFGADIQEVEETPHTITVDEITVNGRHITVAAVCNWTLKESHALHIVQATHFQLLQDELCRVNPQYALQFGWLLVSFEMS